MEGLELMLINREASVQSDFVKTSMGFILNDMHIILYLFLNKMII